MPRCTSLALHSSPRYHPGMAQPRQSVPDALLRLWIMAQMGLAGLYGWLGWQMRGWPDDLPGPQRLQPVEITEFICLFVAVPAAIVVWQRWRETQDRQLAGLALAYAALLVWSLLAWDGAFENGAALAGDLRRLYQADVAIALAAVPVAVRALRRR